MTDWPLEANQKRQLKSQLIVLESVDRVQSVGSILHKRSRVSGIYYAKINGKIALRPRCYIGPEDDQVTFLERVQKKDQVEAPTTLNSKASERMQAIQSGAAIRQRITLHLE